MIPISTRRLVTQKQAENAAGAAGRGRISSEETFLSVSLYIPSHVSVLKVLGGPILLSASGM